MALNKVDFSMSRSGESLNHGLWYAVLDGSLEAIDGDWRNVPTGSGGFFYAKGLKPSVDNPNVLVGKATLYLYVGGNEKIFSDADMDVTVEVVVGRPAVLTAAGVEGGSGRAYFIKTRGINDASEDIELSLATAQSAGAGELAGALADWMRG